MGKTTGILTTLVGASAVVGVGWWLYASEPPAPEETGRRPYVLPVTLAEVHRGDVEPSVQLTGTVRSPTWTQLAFQVGGRLEELAVAEADPIEAGAVLARLYARDAELGVLAAQADLALAERELEKLRAGAREERKRELAARRDVERAEEHLAEAEVRRGRKLVVDRVISDADLDRLVAQHEAAQARAEAAEQLLAEAQAGTRAEDIAIAEAKVDVARAELARAEEDLDKTRLRAPNGGVVVRRFVSVGDYVAVGEPVLGVVDLEALEVQVEIPSHAAAKSIAGERVVITVDEAPDVRLETELDATIPAADERSRNFRGIVRLTPEEARSSQLRPGMFVRLELVLQPARNALVVPSDTIRTMDAGPTLVRAVPAPEGEGLVAELVGVRILATDGLSSAVQSLGAELAAGDRVVLRGVDLAFPGVALLPRPVPGEAATPEAPPADGSEVESAPESEASPASGGAPEAKGAGSTEGSR